MMYTRTRLCDYHKERGFTSICCLGCDFFNDTSDPSWAPDGNIHRLTFVDVYPLDEMAWEAFERQTLPQIEGYGVWRVGFHPSVKWH